jgi:antitoxin Phd
MAKCTIHSNHWTSSEARAKLSEVVRRARTQGPQFGSRRNGKNVVIPSVEDYEKRTGRLLSASKRKGRS